jgi:non-heme chloroperoxidase
MMFIVIRALVWATLFIAFFLIAVPARVLGGAVAADAPMGLQQIAALMTTVAGALITIACVWTFVVVGRGTPAPFDPPRRLVARGPYAVIRNPMYVGAALAMSGAAMYYGSWALMGYVALFLFVTHLFVLIYEEPTLRATFGDAYAAYCADVGRWLPRLAQRRAWFAIVVLCASGPELAAQPAWRDPSPHQVRFVEVEPSVRLEVLDFGGSGRPLVFVSCYLTGHAYDDIAPKLADQFRVYALTRRGFGASDRPEGGYDLQRSADDLLAVLDAMQMRKPILAANSCGGWTVTLLAAQHPDRLGGLAYLEAADDPMLTLEDYDFPAVDLAKLPKRIERPPLDYSSFDAYRRTQKVRSRVAFPEAELRYAFGVKPDGSLGPELMSPAIRKAVTSGSRSKPDFARVRVPVLAVFLTPEPFEEAVKEYVIENDEQRATLRLRHEAGRIMATRWEKDLLAAVPSAKIVELPGASLFMFLSNEADVIRELRAFAASLP